MQQFELVAVLMAFNKVNHMSFNYMKSQLNYISDIIKGRVIDCADINIGKESKNRQPCRTDMNKIKLAIRDGIS